MNQESIKDKLRRAAAQHYIDQCYEPDMPGRPTVERVIKFLSENQHQDEDVMKTPVHVSLTNNEMQMIVKSITDAEYYKQRYDEALAHQEELIKMCQKKPTTFEQIKRRIFELFGKA